MAKSLAREAQSLLRRKPNPDAQVRTPAQPATQQPSIYTQAPDPSWEHAHQHYLQRTIGNQAARAQYVQRAGAFTVGPADDPLEREADQAADRVADADVDGEGAAPAVQRQTAPEMAGGRDGGALSPEFSGELDSARSGGQSLDQKTRGQMEHSFGADFSGVRVHSDGQADKLSRSINADAFTSGRDVFFRDGVWNPGTDGGQHVLAHELTHVVQQGGAAQQPVQRLMTAASFKKETKLFGRKGKSGTFFDGVVNSLQAYEGPMANAPLTARIKHLEALIGTIAQWLKDRGSKSSRHTVAQKLKTDIAGEVYSLRQKMTALQGTEFQDTNEQSSEDSKYGDAMNKLDEIVYNFGVEQGEDDSLQKVQGGNFTALFKEQLAQDPLAGKHRGKGIPAMNPKFAERNIAMQVIDKLLGGNVVPPTFMAQHKGKQGFIMEKVNGKTGRQLEQDKSPEGRAFKQAAMSNPLVRQGLSRIYLLDQICAQVDRHAGNYMIVVENGVIKGVKAIDNDLAFGKDVDMDTMMGMTEHKNLRRWGFIGPLADELTEIDRPFAQKIVDLAGTPNVLKQALQGLLTDDEIDKTVDRLTKLANFLRPMLTNNDPILKTKWD